MCVYQFIMAIVVYGHMWKTMISQWIWGGTLLSDEPASHFLNLQSSPSPQRAENHCISKVQTTINSCVVRDVVFAVCQVRVISACS